jgi:hypothetical protein
MVFLLFLAQRPVFTQQQGRGSPSRSGRRAPLVTLETDPSRRPGVPRG